MSRVLARYVSQCLCRTLVAMVRLYQRTLSTWIGGHCKFRPTCSEYLIQAVQTHGALRGVGMGLWRIARCNPLSQGGYDPVCGYQEGGVHE